MKLKLTTLALFATGLLAGLTLIAPATGADPPATTSTATVYGSASGAIAALSATSITVTDLTCTRNAGSPSLDGYKVGDAVGLGCANGAVIVIVDKRPPSTTTTTTPAQGSGARDPISALSATSITVGPLTCSLGPSSPSVPFKIGDRVKIGCIGGVLAYVVADNDVPKTPTTTTSTTTPAPPAETTAPIVTRGGTLTAIGEHSLTVDGLTCYLYPSSPSITGFKVGDRVGVACQANVLVKIVSLGDEPKAPALQPPRDDLQTRLGPITALSTTSITVDGLTCSVGPSSPNVAGFELGDKVGIGCSSGVLVKIGVPQNDDDGGFRVAVQLGPIASLRVDGITVGSLSCKLAATSPSVASYEVGDRVGIGCAGGILFMIGALPSPDSAPKLEIKHALVRHFNACIKRGSERCIVAGVLRRLVHKK
jgi:hypothetical protein